MSEPAFVINGWKIYAHPLFLAQLEAYQANYLATRQKHPTQWEKKTATKLYAALLKTAFAVIPADPMKEEFRQGSTLGTGNKHWFRATFLQQFRLFFRYSEDKKAIVLAGVNDDETKRACGAKTDAYVVFKKMLEAGDPPGSWDALIKASATEENAERFRAGAGQE